MPVADGSIGDSGFAAASADTHLPHGLDVASRAERLSLRVLQLGAAAVVVVAATWKEFELDRFFVPKEAVLHVTALIAGILAIRAIERVRFTAVDLLLGCYVAAGVVSALFATNGWVAMRALTLSASGIVIFWTARGLRRAGFASPLLGAIALAIVLGAATSLLQTYGVRTDLFSLNRAPGGTLGNRNFIAHMAAFGLPVVLLVSLSARSWLTYLLAGAGSMVVVATLVLTRSRAGFLALGAVIVVIAVGILLSPALRRHGTTWRRIAGILALSAAGIAGALLAPNSLNWRSDNPYLESITGVANFQEGSGRGRLVQYRQSMRMALDNPILGVGPGNWAVEYAHYAARGDPSMSGSQPGTTSNPWPSSDWVAFISERGVVATALLALALLLIGFSALRRLVRTAEPLDALRSAALLATIAAAIVAGMFDAVLLLALPALLVWAAIGVLWSPADAEDATDAEVAAVVGSTTLRNAAQTAVVAGMIFLAGIGAVRSTAQLVAMAVQTESESATWLSRAALVDPGSYELRVRLARRGSGLDRAARCTHANAAAALQPNAREARNLASGCD